LFYPEHTVVQKRKQHIKYTASIKHNTLHRITSIMFKLWVRLPAGHRYQ